MNFRPLSSSAVRGILFLLCALFFAAGLLRLNDLSLYNPDSTRYVIWGNSLAHGQGFLDRTQPEADRYVVHAPLYALLIAPVELVFPFSLVAVKVWTLVWGVLALVLLYRWLSRTAGSLPALVGCLLLVCNPLTLMYSTEALSEIPFIVFLLAAMALSERVTNAPNDRTSFIMLVVVISFSALLREVGVALVLAGIIFFLIRRQPGRAAILFACSALLLGAWYVRNQILVGPSAGSQSGNLSVLTQRFVTPASSSLFRELPLRGWLQFKEYVVQLGGMIFYPLFGTQQISFVLGNSPVFNLLRDLFDTIKFLVVVVILPLIAYGAYTDMAKKGTGLFRLITIGCYLGVILIYPIHDIRFLFPLLPLLIYYILLGGKQWIRRKNSEITGNQHALILAAAILLQLPNVVCLQQILRLNLTYQHSPTEFYQSLSRTQDYPPLFAHPWPLMGEWIRAHSPDSIVIASPAKEIAILIGQRKILELDQGTPLPEFEKNLRENDVRYLITSVRWEDVRTYEFSMKESHRFWFEPVFGVANLRLMKIHSSLADPDSQAMSRGQVYDTLTASGLLRKGRSEMLSGDYDNASKTLAGALRLAPFQPEVVYQNLVVGAFRGDTVAALSHFQRILTLTQAGSFAYIARAQVEALQSMRDAAGSRSVESHDLKIFDAATAYWNLGYPRRASEVMNILLYSGSNYFVGLLWGFHFARQTGDTVVEHAYLKRLETIDSSNAVVKVFEHFLRIDDSLRTTPTASGKSRLHLELSKLYSQIELNEEAVDEGERGLFADPSNGEAMTHLGKLFLQKGKSMPALSYYRKAYEHDPANLFVRQMVDSLREKL